MKKILLIGFLLAVVSYLTYNFGLQELDPTPPVVKQKQTKKRLVAPNYEPALPTLSDTMPPIEELDDVTSKIVGFVPELSFKERNELVWQLRNRNLSKSDFDALLIFLKQNPEKSGSQLSWHSLKNDLLVALIDDGRYKESTAQQMINIISDETQHPVMREYVLQYTTDYFERHWWDHLEAKSKENFTKVDRVQQSAMIATMLNSLQAPEGPIAGTALIRLHELSEKFSFIDTEQIDAETIRLVSDVATSESSRMAALSVAATRKIYSLQKEAEDILFDEGSSVMLRMASMSAVTKLKPDEQFPTKLNSYFIENQKTDKRLKKAAQLSLKKLMKQRG